MQFHIKSFARITLISATKRERESALQKQIRIFFFSGK